MKLGYTILYVPDVPAAVAFYERAFGLKLRFIHESNLYAELETGETALAFAGDIMADTNGLTIRPNRSDEIAAGFEIALITNDPKSAFATAVNAGAVPVVEPSTKPWGQIVGYVRDLNGCMVELCSPIAS